MPTLCVPALALPWSRDLPLGPFPSYDSEKEDSLELVTLRVDVGGEDCGVFLPTRGFLKWEVTLEPSAACDCGLERSAIACNTECYGKLQCFLQ